MESVQLSTHGLMGLDFLKSGPEVQEVDDRSNSEEMKNIRRARLRRMVNADPSLAGKLVALEASPVYNAKGDLIQAVGASFGVV